MEFLAGKTPSEKKKLIAAGVLGALALVSLYLAFGQSFFRSSATATPKSSPTPRSASTTTTAPDKAMPTRSEQDFVYQTTPVAYFPGLASAPDPGRNIFAFYEPPPPCRGADCPTPTIKPTPLPPTPKPEPTPPVNLRQSIPMNVYAGSPGFRLQVDGEPFTAAMRIYFNGVELPTAFVSQTKLAADVPAAMIAQEGQRQIAVRTADGVLFSNPVVLSVNPPPKPTVQYIGMIGRTRYNNDTAYFVGPSGGTPFGARLNDVVGGQFRLISIAPAEVVFEDVSLGFKHRVAMNKNPAGNTAPGANPSFPISGSIPGIPDGIPRYVPPGQQPRPQPRPGEKKDDVDDKDDRPE